MEDKDLQKQEELPTLDKVMGFLMTPGTVLGELEFPGKPIIFNNSSQQAVKSLEVTIHSTETSKTAALHSLHAKTRSV
jgi:hypothetical protein